MGRTTTGKPLAVLRTYVKPQAAVVRQSLCRCGFLIAALRTLGLILFYYVFSISLTFYNQRFIHRFPFPLSITMVHLTTKFTIAAIVRWCLYRRSGKERVVLPWSLYVKCILPPGIFSSLDIGLSNWSFEFVTISLYTMTKSTVIIFILGFSIFFRLEKPRCSLIFVVLFIAVGLLLFTYDSTQFSLNGFLLVLGASFLSGLRWTTSQLVVQRSDLGLTNPVDMMYHVQPWMMLALLPLSVAFESVHLATTEDIFAYKDSAVLLQNLLILFSGAFLAFMLEFTEYLLLGCTSSLTLSISGIIKEVVTLGLAVEVNGDHMNPINVVGLVVCLLGITLHVVFKAVSMREDAEEAKGGEESMEMLLSDRYSGDDDDEEDIFNVQTDR